MKLLSFFKLTYLFPSSIFLIISIIISFFCTLTFLNDYKSDEQINKISAKNDKNDWILISSIEKLLSHRIQAVFDYLITAESYMKNFYGNFNDEYLNNETIQGFMNVHLNNLKSYYMKRSDNERDYLDKMTYIIDDSEDQINFNTSEPKKKLQYKYLYIYSQLIPIFKSFYDNFERKEGFALDSLYIMNRKTETFALYPIKYFSNYDKIFRFYQESTNHIISPNNCRNKSRQIPEYFYIFCRESFKTINSIYKSNQKRTMFITSPYQNLFDNKTSSDNVISICHIFNLTQKNNEDYQFDDYYQLFLNEEIVICADIVVNNYFKILNNYEEQLSGYFYITKTNSKLPLFFPGMNDDIYPNDITRFEFNFTFYNFDTTNVVNFNTYVLPSLIKEYNETCDLILPNNANNYNSLYNSVKNIPNKSFFKGDLELKYFIYPIYFNNRGNKEHILSIIYVVDKNIFKNQLNYISPKLYQIVIVSLFISIIFSIIFGYIMHYIIYNFSMNMTKSIKVKLKQNAKLNQKKHVKYYYQGIDINKLITLGLIQKKAKKHKLKSDMEDEYSVNDFDRNSNDIFGRFIYGNENILKKNNETDEDLDKLLQKQNDNSKEEDDDGSEDGGILPVVVDSQFNDKVKLLYDLNKVRAFMRGEQINLKGNNITNY